LAPGLYEAELRYMRDNEWATCADDVLWRRSKLGLHLEPGSLDDVIRRIDGWFASSKPEAEPRAASATPSTSSTFTRTVV
jgi:glycerol-3-phosphate dehydrogenase